MYRVWIQNQLVEYTGRGQLTVSIAHGMLSQYFRHGG